MPTGSARTPRVVAVRTLEELSVPLQQIELDLHRRGEVLPRAVHPRLPTPSATP